MSWVIMAGGEGTPKSSEVPLQTTYSIIIVIIYYYLGGMHAMVHLWRSEDSPMEWILPFHLYVSSGNWTGVARFAQQYH